MPVITKIEQQKNKKRVNIFVDNAFFCGMLKETAVINSLKVGKEIDTGSLERAVLESEAKSAFEKAADYLAGRMHTAKELSDKLIKKGYQKQAVDEAIKKLKEYKYIDDGLFAKEFVSQNSKMSKRMIENKLFSKGVARDVIQSVLEVIDLDSEFEICRHQAEKYLRSHKIQTKSDLQKLYASLARKGFSFDQIGKTCKLILNNFDEDDVEISEE